MRVTIALAFLAFHSVSSEEKTVRIVTWNVEHVNTVPSNLHEVLTDKAGYDIIFLALQGVKNTLYDHWKRDVNSALEKEKLGLFASQHHKNIAHFMGYHEKHQSNFSASRLVDYYEDAMIALCFGWHRQNITIIHGREPRTDNKTQQTYYKTFNDTLAKTGHFDFFFITGEISYLAKMLRIRCWKYSGFRHYYSPNKIMYKSDSPVTLQSYYYLDGFDQKPLIGDYKINIDTTQKPLTKLENGKLS